MCCSVPEASQFLIPAQPIGAFSLWAACVRWLSATCNSTSACLLSACVCMCVFVVHPCVCAWICKWNVRRSYYGRRTAAIVSREKGWGIHPNALPRSVACAWFQLDDYTANFKVLVSHLVWSKVSLTTISHRIAPSRASRWLRADSNMFQPECDARGHTCTDGCMCVSVGANYFNWVFVEMVGKCNLVRVRMRQREKIEIKRRSSKCTEWLRCLYDVII